MTIAGTSVGATSSKSVDVAGSTIRSLVRGHGAPIVYFHHSFGLPEHLPVADELAADFAVHVPDLPGFGSSDRPEWARHPRDLAMMMGHWIAKQGLGAVPIIGCGWGGWLACELATMRPEVVSHLVLVGSAGLLPREGKGKIFDQILVSHNDYVRASFKHEAAFAELYDPELPDDTLFLWDLNREMMTRVSWKPYMYNRQMAPLLAEVVAPTLLVWGDDDRIVPIDCAHQFLERLPHARLEVVADCGHAVDLERPAALAAAVRQHVGA